MLTQTLEGDPDVGNPLEDHAYLRSSIGHGENAHDPLEGSFKQTDVRGDRVFQIPCTVAEWPCMCLSSCTPRHHLQIASRLCFLRSHPVRSRLLYPTLFQSTLTSSSSM